MGNDRALAFATASCIQRMFPAALPPRIAPACAGFGRLFFTCINFRQNAAKPIKTPLSKGLHAQVKPQPPSYIAGFAVHIPLGPMELLDSSEYQALACSVFASVAEELSQLVPAARVEHVGASSVPGAISRGDLDICVIVAASSHPSTVKTLEASGYVVKADTRRTPELCMLLSPRKELDVALQVVAEGSQFEFFMRFRDALRADPLLVEQYNQLKRNFASTGAERYRDEKATFIEAVLRLA